jgi:nucleotide-binding universal stress UspA family protein
MSTIGFDVILCPVDFSDISANALRQAAALAECANGRLTAAHAISFEAPPYFTEGKIEELKRQAQESKLDAERSLIAFVESTLGEGGRNAETIVVEGSPSEAIPKLAEATGAGLIVMGTHGRSGVNRWMLGSVAERVIRESRIPVLTTRDVPHQDLRHIVVPVNDTALARLALTTAAELAQRCGATVTVLNIVERNSDSGIESLCAWVPAEARARCDIRELVRHGDAAEEILSLASEIPCDLIVLGAPARRFFDGMILSRTALRVIRHAACPVLSIGGSRDTDSL